MKPNVLQLIDSFHQGGTERQAVQLTRLLHATGRYNVYVACLTDAGVLRRDIERLDLGPIHAFPTISFYHPSIVPQLARLVGTLRALKIDLVHAHDFYTNIFGMAAATIARVPARIASRREMDPGRSRAQRWVERRAFDCADAIVVNADAIAADLVAGGVAPAKIRTIYNGVDFSRFPPVLDGPRADRLAALGIPNASHRVFVTILANLWLELKDHPTFLRAAKAIKAAVPDCGFIIAGEGALLEPMRELAAQLGIADDVFFTGRCQHVAELLSISDVCVLSSISEGFANVIVEYMAAGRPVVATAVGGTGEAVRDGETGFVVAPGDDGAMADRIVLLLRDADRRAVMGARGREVALATFSSDAQLARAELLYRQVLGSAAVSPDSPPTALPEHRPAAARESEDIARRPAASRAS